MTKNEVNLDELESIESQIQKLQKKKLHEERKIRLLTQKEDLKRKIIELNLQLSEKVLTCEGREPIYKEIIKTQESLLFISGYYARLLNEEEHQ